jgi:hypothetical protein
MSTLASLLDEGVRFDAEFGHSSPNRRSTALAALARLGAPEERLAAWAATYERTHPLHEAPAFEPWPAGDPWPDRLGDLHAWPAYRGFFLEWLEQEGAGDVLVPVLPQLMRGVSAAGFHAVLRLACAVESRRRAELADALAYWACRWQPLPDAEAAAAADLPRLAQRAAVLYAATGHDTARSLVTGANAVRVLLAHADEDDRPRCIARYAQAFAWAQATLPRSRRPAPAAWPWPRLTAAAIAQDDAGTIELVDACVQWHAAHGGDVWARAATRAVISTPRA